MGYFKTVGVSVRRLPRLLSVIALITLLSTVVSVVQAQPPALILSKTTDGNVTTAEVGQILHYRIRFECSSLSTSCGQLEITDTLQAGLSYLPSPESSVPAGFRITYNAGTRTVTITKDDNNFLDGTQFDAVIAVQVDYNLRPLPTIINNTVNGRVDPPGSVTWITATPKSAPPITVDTATLDWGMTKTLYRPTINPTVDTNVTYQVALCPNTTIGNVALQNVVMTDTLPAGSVFVSASDGGTQASGLVTWPTVLGPIYPPACITRYVTVRFPGTTFTAGVSTVTNTANANGEYIGSAGAVIGPLDLATDPITHPIDPISEVPNYSKSDAGDPVGINGTGRFILNLNTNSTNYPSNNVVLIDNMPPNLQVTEVTSGSWNAAFNNVRAYVEYSTNNGTGWTLFPGQPISYNTNTTYTAPATNITNVRWRFEYDDPIGAPFYENQGLPYTWSFTSSPQIHFIPRLTATTADDPPTNTPLPVATAGNTYTNCLQVSRTNSAGVAVTEPCHTEDMTVRGNYASLRTYKNETPGTSWDDVGDPSISSFTSDTTLLPNDTLRYVITVELTERSSAALINPTIRDTLPAGLIFVRNGTAQLDGVNLPLVQQPTFTQVGSNLTWAWNDPAPALTVNSLVLGSRFLTVEFYGRIPRGQAPGPYSNNLTVVTDSVNAFCEIGSTVEDSTLGDLDGDGDPTDPACRNPDTFIVERSAALRGEKWIRSTDPSNAQVVNATSLLPDASCPDGGTAGLTDGGSNPFTRFPCVSQAFPQGALGNGEFVPPSSSTTLDDFEYNIRIFNDGNVDMTQYVLYDILPYFGDVGSGGTLSSTARMSEFQPLMRDEVAFISGPSGLTAGSFTIEYNNTINPCRPEVFNLATGVNSPGGCDNTWTAWSANARSYRIRMNVGVTFPQTASSPELRFGVPMYIPADAPPVGTFSTNDPLSLEIAWNSFSHTGSYLDPLSNIRDLLASEPRKVGITIPERMSIGNRVWRDADNSGTINAPDDTNPGIGSVVVNLYRDANNDGIADGVAIATTQTDANGYYLFSNIIFDSVTADNNRYIVGIPTSNFGALQPLANLRSSTGPFPTQAYANPALGTTDSDDNGRDPVSPGLEVFSASINLTRNAQPTGEAISGAARDGVAGRGVNGEQDTDSNLQIDFGFFSQVDYFSIGNRIWLDDGAGGGVLNNGIRESGEAPIAGVTVEIYRDGNANGQPDTAERIRTDVTDAGGYYLFDQLDPGNYFVVIPSTNFAPVAGPLRGLFSSQPTGTELVGVAGNPTTPNTDRDDNGINVLNPAATGVRSGVIVLTIGTPEATGEPDLSGNPDPGAATHFNNDPTAWDGPISIGRYGEDDDNSNITVDFGFIPPLSIGNHVWLDSGITGAGVSAEIYNDGIQNGTEVGIASVALSLFFDINDDGDFLDTVGGVSEATALRTTTTDASGYYLFDGLQPGNYRVGVNAANFGASQPLVNLQSSTGNSNDILTDINDNGIDDINYLTNGIRGNTLSLRYGTQPLTETDLPANTPANTTAYGANLRGRFGELDVNSNLTMDFGFIDPPYSLGNRVWLDTDNSGTINGAETGIAGVTVRLLDSLGDPVDNPNITGPQDYVLTTDATGYYRFDGLPTGIYVVEVTADSFATGNPLFGLASSTGDGQLADPNAAAPGTDSDDNGLDTAVAGAIRSGTIALGPDDTEPTGETDLGAGGQGTIVDARGNMTVDFGFYPAYSLGNRVWLDTDNSGIIDGPDGGSPGMANVLVNLLIPSGATVDNPNLTGTQPYTAMTDANGYYRFDNLAAGDYVVEVDASNFTVGTGVLFGSASSTGAGQLADPNLPAPGTDSDDNGLDTPVAGAIRSGTVTLGPGASSEPSGEADVPLAGAFAGQGPTADSRANMTVDFGFYPAYSLGNRVWADLDNSGDINGADTATPGIAGVTVNLLTLAGAIVDNPNLSDIQAYTLVTDANGYYRFDNLPAGDYVVEIDAANFAAGSVLQNAVSSIGAAQEGLPNTDGDSNDNGLDVLVAGAVRSGTVTLNPGNAEPTSEVDVPLTGAFAGQGPTIDLRANMTVDFGFVPGFSLGNRVWMDDGIGGGVSNDGIINGGELGIAGVQVQLLDNLGNAADNPAVAGIQPYIVTTDANGYYRFDRLPAGDYRVEVIASNFNVGQPLQSVGSSNVTEASPNADVDNTDNGIDALPTVAVRSGLVTLGPGYNEPLAAAEPDIPLAGGFPGQGTVDAWANMTVDFGFVRQFSLGNRVWRDDGTGGGVLNDGIQNGSEPGINAVTVRLLDALGNPADNPNLAGIQDYTVITSPQGYYRFDNLPQGNYVVEIVAANFVGGGTLANFSSSTGASQEATPNADVDVNDNGLDVPVAGGIRSGQVTLGPLAAEPTGENAPFDQGAPDLQANMTVDFGFVPGLYSLGNRVWIDTDNSGTINGGEAGVNGVTVRLLNNVGTLITSMTTAGGGYYRFDNLAAGNYIVEVAASSFGAAQPLFGLVSSTGVGQEANPNSDGDSNDNGIDTPFAGATRSGTVTLGPGDSEPTTEADLSNSGQGALDIRANMTVDFGFITPPITFSLGNRVWFDADNNGTINAFDGPTPGITNVTVTLLNAGGAIVATTTTDATGHYRFDTLAAGDYIVEIATGNFTVGQPLLNLISSSGPGQEANPNSNVDSNDNGLDLPVGGAIRSGIVTLGPTAIEPVGETDVVAGGAPDNQANMTVDFGFTNAVNVYSIGNHVWRDNGAGANTNNGRMDAGEPGINNVTVNLLDSSGNTVVATTTTDANGYYRFDNLPTGDYIVQIAASNFTAGNPLEGTTTSTGALQEANPNADVDLNDNGLDVLVASAVRSGVVTLGGTPPEPINEADLAASGQGTADNRANMTVDFGFVDAFSLGNRVWNDNGAGGGAANNGIQDGTEPGIANVTVRLLDSTGNTLIATTTTDGNGYYRFDSLVPGTYIVEIAADNFSIGNPLNGLSSSSVTNPNPDSDIDLDDNGLDVAVGGAIRSGQVTLGPTAAEPTGETDLAASGQGSPDNRANMTVDFGFGVPTNTFSLGNRVWLDDGTGVGGVANNGIQDGTEIGEVGVAVNLLDNTGTFTLATTITDINGYYRFDGLAAGNYIVEVAASNFGVSQPLNGLLSSAVTVADPNSDVDVDDNGIDAAPGSAIRSGLVTLGLTEPTGETDLSPTGQGSPDDRANMTVDFGFAPPTTTYSLGNRVWLDADNSGTLNGAEVGVAGVTVRVLNITGTTTVGTTTTDANGYYRLDNLAPGDYIVEIASTNFTAGQPLEGLASSSGAGQEATPNSDVDSNDNGLDTIVNGGVRSGTVTLGPGDTEPVAPGQETDVAAGGPFAGQGAQDNRSNLTVDFGFTSSYSLGNRVWFDVNNNSLLDAGETGVPGVQVEVYRDSDGNNAYTAGTDTLINTVTTDGTGYYLFTGLAAANYIVVIPASNFDNAGDPLNGYYSSATARNPADGTLAETGAPDPDNDTDSDDNGTTSGVLGTGNGIVVSLPVTIGPTEPILEADPTSATFQDSTPDNRSNTTVDFGFYTMTLGNLVWFDADDNGVVNGTETGLDGVTIYLYPLGSDLNGAPLATTITNNGGLYSFPGLAAGDYIVRIPASNFTGVLAGFTSSTGGTGNPFETLPGVDPNPGTDNDDNGVHTAGPASPVSSRPITLTPVGLNTIVDNATGRTTNNTLDFGLKSSAPLIFSLGNRVFLDFDNSGTQDASEPGISGVRLRLLDSASNPYDTDPNTAGVQEYPVTTDVSGYYRFDNLPAGDYIVQILEANFQAGGALVNYSSSTPDELLPNNDVDRNDNGIGTAFIPGMGIVSGVVTLGPTEPTGETDIGTGGQGATDIRANMTVDFGFTPPTGLIIRKDDGLNAILVGSTTTYTVNIFNNTGIVQNNVQFLDDVPIADPEGFDPASVSWTCSSSPGGLCPNGNGTSPTINETIATIPVGGRVIYSISGRVRPCQTSCGVSITNIARLGTGEQDDDVNGIISDPPIGTKTGTVINGTTIHWQMTWFSTTAPNVGQMVVITDSIPAGQTFAGNLTCQVSGISTQTSCSFVNGATVWEGTLFGGTGNHVVISLDVTIPGPGNYINSATLIDPGTNVIVDATASVDVTNAAAPTQVPPEQCNIRITPNPAFAVPGSRVDWSVNVTITDNSKPNILTITLPGELTLLGVDLPKGAVLNAKGNIITITVDPAAALGPYPTILVRTRIKSNLKAPFTITVSGWLNDHECEASITILSVAALPDTGQRPPLNLSSLLLLAACTSAAIGLFVSSWRRRKHAAS